MKAKKLLALILAVCMVLALCACGSSGTTTDTGSSGSSSGSGSADSGSADTGSSSGGSAGFTWNGQKEVWAILPTTGVPGLTWNTDFAMIRMQNLDGWNYSAKDAQGDPSKQVQFVEDAIAAGNVGALIIAAMDVDMLEDVCKQASDKGIAVAFLGAKANYPVAGSVYTQYSIAGMFAVKAAEDWVQKRVAEGGNVPANADGKYEVSVDTYYDITDGIYKSNAMVGTVDESDVLTGVSNTTSYGNSAQEDAYNNTSAILAAHPDCRIFIAYEPDEAIGMNSYITDYAAQNGLDLADFCVVPCYAMDATFQQMWAEVYADHSANAIKGYSTYGGKVNEEELADCVAISGSEDWAGCYATGRALATILLGVCGYDDQGYTWNYGDIFWDDVDGTNVYDFEIHYTFGDTNPAEEYQVEQRTGSF